MLELWLAEKFVPLQGKKQLVIVIVLTYVGCD